MKRLFLLPLFTSLTMTPIAHAGLPAHLWSQRFGGTDYDIGYAVATDASGNVFVTGYFGGTAVFGGDSLVSAGGRDIFLTKYDATGAYQWSERFGGTGDDVARSVATDAFGNVFVAGFFGDTADFGGGPLTSAGGQDIFIAKYDAAGAHQWSERFGSIGNDIAYSIATDASGNVFVTGYFGGTVDFGGGNLMSAGALDIYLAKYNAAGAHQWSKRFGSTFSDSGQSVATDASGNVYVTGGFSDTVDFGGGNLVSAGARDIFLASYNAAGFHRWSRRFGGSDGDGGVSVATDASGNVFATGYFFGSADFGGGNLYSAGNEDIFLAKYDATGAYQWSRRFGGFFQDSGTSVAADASGNVFMTGYFQDTVYFGGSNLASAGGDDIVLASYDAGGAHRWSQRFGSNSDDIGYSVATDVSGNVLATGYFWGSVDFGGGDLVAAGEHDIFLAKYANDTQEPDIASIADIGNDQGRQVKITFVRSGYDQPGTPTVITSYEAYRRNDAPPAAMPASDEVARAPGALLDQGWTEVGSVHAHGVSEYSIDVPTIGDSTLALGQYYSTFFIRAATGGPYTFFDSAPDSGYSLDNLAPAVPQNLAYSAGQLSWAKSPDEDFDYFTVYGSSTDSFGAAAVVDYSIDTHMDVTASPYSYYFVTATDFSGNESGAATVSPVTGVGGTPNSYVLSVSNYPNPFNPSTTVSYTVPARGSITVAIYDVRGARVATLVDNEVRDAGPYRTDWNGRTDAGTAVSSGVYFVRIEHASGTRTKKMVLLK
jgi:hypothetical protein